MSGPTAIAVDQPADFAFSGAFEPAVEKVIAKYPDGRQASAVLPLLDLAQRQHGGWVPQAAIEHIAERLGMAKIRVMEVATFYTMINLAPVGKYHLQVCGTTPCLLRGCGEVFRAIQDEIGIGHGETSDDGLFTCTEVECLGACVNAPMVQVNDDFVEDLDYDNFVGVLRTLKNGGEMPTGSLVGRHSSEPEGGAQTLTSSSTPDRFDPAKIYGDTALPKLKMQRRLLKLSNRLKMKNPPAILPPLRNPRQTMTTVRRRHWTMRTGQPRSTAHAMAAPMSSPG